MSRRSSDRWIFERLVRILPDGVSGSRAVVALHVGLFEAAVLGVGWYYRLPAAVVAGTVAVIVAGVGSLVMLRLGAGNRRLAAPSDHASLLFGSSVEVVLAVQSFVALVVYLFVVAPSIGAPVLAPLIGANPPPVVAYLALLILWDLCYRAATSWWIATVSLWRVRRVELDAENRALARRLDATNGGFALTYLALLPFLTHAPLLLAAVVCYAVTVAGVSLVASLLTRGRDVREA